MKRKNSGFTYIEAICAIVIISTLGGALVVQPASLSNNALEVNFRTISSAFTIGAQTVRLGKQIQSPNTSYFVSGDRLFCVLNDSPNYLITSYSATQPVSNCDAVEMYPDQGTMNGYCQSLFSGIVEQGPAVGSNLTDSFPAIPDGFSGALPNSAVQYLPNPVDYPGQQWAAIGLEEGEGPFDSGYICYYFDLVSLARPHFQLRIISYNLLTGTVSSYDMPLASSN